MKEHITQITKIRIQGYANISKWTNVWGRKESSSLHYNAEGINYIENYLLNN